MNDSSVWTSSSELVLSYYNSCHNIQALRTSIYLLILSKEGWKTHKTLVDATIAM